MGVLSELLNVCWMWWNNSWSNEKINVCDLNMGVMNLNEEVENVA